ncbi:hydroxymethylbilane synthase [Erythrobacter sp. HKB08]|uniref:hydroxymethylbilane synthase n=1 Tax=Erythrobacter sp. HKB08 TaxID=2502843 RepID=UPI00100884C0|nr:hydroxymethylbilane synthase [Erythrobacter sp. HKB08]
MSTDVKLRLGTRQSPLALAQAEEARDRLCAAHGWSKAQVELVKVVASGDKIQDQPLAEIGGKALWTKELDAWLAEGRIDVSVHSMKDVETLRTDELRIAAMLPREDVRDVLIGAESLASLAPGSRVGTSAPRRAAQLLHARPDCEIVGMRGNVATRLGKLDAGEADATFLAAAGLSRLGMSVGIALDSETWLPAPAQGAIGLECRFDDGATIALLDAVNHGQTFDAVMLERALLEGLGGTCHSPIAVLSEKRGDSFHLRAAIFSADGRERQAGEIDVAAGDFAAMHAFAQDLLDKSPPAIRKLFDGQQ